MKRWFLFILKLACILGTIGLPVLAAYGLAFPWRVAEEALPQHRGSLRLLVGFSYDSSSSGSVHTETISHTYAIVPSAFRTLATVEVTKDSRGVNVQVQRFGFVEVAAVFVVSLIGSWWFFIRRSRNRSHERST